MTLTNVAPVGMMPMTDFEWPVTYRYQIVSVGVAMEQEITVDVPLLKDHPDETRGLGRPLWIAGIAPAMSFTVAMLQCSVLIHRYKGAWLNGGAIPTFGSRFAVPSRAAETPVAVLHTDHDDKYSRRRFFFPGAPRNWVTDTRLNEEGAGELRSVLAGLYGGLKGSIENAPMDWLIYYPKIFRSPIGGLTAPGFRRVSWVRLCEYTIPSAQGLLDV